MQISISSMLSFPVKTFQRARKCLINAGKEFSRNDKDLRLTESLWLKIKLEKVNNKEIN